MAIICPRLTKTRKPYDVIGQRMYAYIHINKNQTRKGFQKIFNAYSDLDLDLMKLNIELV